MLFGLGPTLRFLAQDDNCFFARRAVLNEGGERRKNKRLPLCLLLFKSKFDAQTILQRTDVNIKNLIDKSNTSMPSHHAAGNHQLATLRKAAFSKMPDHLLHDIFGTLSSFGDEEDFNIPEMIWNIKGPAIHVLPVAIYV